MSIVLFRDRGILVERAVTHSAVPTANDYTERTLGDAELTTAAASRARERCPINSTVRVHYVTFPRNDDVRRLPDADVVALRSRAAVVADALKGSCDKPSPREITPATSITVVRRPDDLPPKIRKSVSAAFFTTWMFVNYRAKYPWCVGEPPRPDPIYPTSEAGWTSRDWRHWLVNGVDAGRGETDLKPLVVVAAGCAKQQVSFDNWAVVPVTELPLGTL